MTKIIVGARTSPLSLVQVQEVLNELRVFSPQTQFEIIAVKTTGDKDRTTSLRDLDKTDFFTKEIDDMLLNGTCRIAIHSAKDLPDPLPQGLKIIALTFGKDSSDSLVMQQHCTIDSLPSGAIIATSSKRREDNVKQLRPDLSFVDIRGTISERLEVLESGQIDGVVIAEAALIRLNLTHHNRVKLPGATTPLQGQLAILARCDDAEMETLFAPLDSRKKKLYLGLKMPQELIDQAIHYPLIQIIPRKTDRSITEGINYFDEATHIIVTSQSTLEILTGLIDITKNDDKAWVAVGKKTAEALMKAEIKNVMIAEEETAEGIVELLKKLNLTDAKVLWPHAAQARPVIRDYLRDAGINFFDFILYDTKASKPPFEPQFENIEELYFTSPSTVEAFIKFFGSIPQDKIVHAIGRITEESIKSTR